MLATLSVQSTKLCQGDSPILYRVLRTQYSVLCIHTLYSYSWQMRQACGCFLPLASARLIPALVLITAPGGRFSPWQVSPDLAVVLFLPLDLCLHLRAAGAPARVNGGPLPYPSAKDLLNPLPFVFTLFSPNFQPNTLCSANYPAPSPGRGFAVQSSWSTRVTTSTNGLINVGAFLQISGPINTTGWNASQPS